MVLQAHNHNYQGTYLISYNEDGPSKPIVMDRETREYSQDPKGPIFVTVGTAGRDLHNFPSHESYVVRQFLRHGFLNVNVTDNGTNLTAIFYENREGKDKDHFSIIKSRQSQSQQTKLRLRIAITIQGYGWRVHLAKINSLLNYFVLLKTIFVYVLVITSMAYSQL